MRQTGLILACTLLPALAAKAQSSSLLRAPVYAAPAPAAGSAQPAGPETPATEGSPFAAMPPRESLRASTRSIERVSIFAVSPIPPRKFKVNDLVNIAVQQQKKYSADGTTNTKKEWDLSGKLQEWFHIYPHERLGSDPLQNGKPGFQFNTKNENKMKGENEREDKFITHIQATIIDVKPNGNLVLEASSEEEHDEEHFTITLTGVCRSEDVGPSNTILSTQIANLVLVEKNKGAVRDATTRGWIPKVLDYAKPF